MLQIGQQRAAHIPHHVTYRRGRHHIGDQPLIARGVLMDNDHTLLDERVLIEGGFNLTQLDPHPAQLDHLVDAPDKVKVAVRQIADKVAGAVEGTLGGKGEACGRDELVGSELGAVPIAACNLFTADIKLARDPNGDGLPVGIQDIDLGVVIGAANGRGGCTVCAFGPSNANRRFGGAIAIAKTAPA